MKAEPTNNVRAAFVGGLFAVTTACITGVFLIVNTLIQTGFIILDPSLQIGGFSAQAAVAGDVTGTPTPEGRQEKTATPDGAQREALDTSVKSGWLVCAAGEALEVETGDSPLRFPEGQGPAVVCWIGPQAVLASGKAGLEVKEVKLPEGDREGEALSVALAWGKELAAEAGDCRGVPAGCNPVGVAVVRPDGSVLRP